MRLLLSLLPLLILFMPSVACAQSLDELEAQTRMQGAWDYQKALGIGKQVNAGIEKLIQSDELKTPEDFRRAGLACLFAAERELSNVSRGYQLLLTALALGDQKTGKEMGKAWDSLMECTGRGPRIEMHYKENEPDLAPEVVRNVYCLKPQADAKDNPEVQQIVDEDQKVRNFDWSKVTQAQLIDMGKNDEQRLRRIKEIVRSKDGLKTAKDFANAALVCQHGKYFLDYALAHELSICSLLLGNKDPWLAGASYDRMLSSANYPQRFDTQYSGQEMHMNDYTTDGVNDRMRKAVVNRTLEESKARQLK